MTDQYEANLASFDDALTMRHSRTFPHEIDLVWTAITVGEHLNRWLLKTAQVEPWEGGRCSFTWGGDVVQVGVVRDVDPPRTIRFDLGTSYLRFELTEIDGGTHVDLVHGFSPGAHVEPATRDGGDQPAGPTSPWRPDFAHGFHEMLDALAHLLDGSMALDEDLWSWGARTGRHDDGVAHAHVEAYRRHIREKCPPVV